MKKILLCMAVSILAVACNRKGTFDASGSFEATEITVSSEVAGRLISFDVEEGDSVGLGQQVGVIDTVQLYLQKMQLSKQGASVLSNRPDIAKQVSALKEQIAKQETERQRVENLLKDGAATPKQLDDVNAQIKVLKGQLDAQVATLRNNISSIDDNSSAIELQIAQVNDRLAKCHIVSPVAVTEIAKYVDQGEFVGVVCPLVKVAHLDNVFLRAYFTPDQLAKVKIGQKVTVTADFGGNEKFDYPGTITWIASESEFTPKTIQTKDTRANLSYAVKIAVKNDGKIKLGLYGEVRL